MKISEGSTQAPGTDSAPQPAQEQWPAFALQVFSSALTAATLSSLVTLPRGSLAGAGACVLLTLPATLACCAALRLGARRWPALLLGGARPWFAPTPRLFVGAAVFGLGAWSANLLLADAAFQSRTLRAYLVVLVLAALAFWRSAPSTRFGSLVATHLTLPIVATLSAFGLGLVDTHFYPFTYTRLHVPLLLATLVLFSVGASGARRDRPVGLVWAARVATLIGFLLVVVFGSADREQTYRSMLRSSTSQQRLLLAARSLLDRDGDGFAMRLGGADCNDHDRRTFPLSLRGKDCLGWAEHATAAPANEWPRGAKKSSSAPDVIVLLTIDAFRCGFDRAESVTALRSACPELTRLAKAGRLRLDAHTTYPRTDEAMGSLNSGALRFDPSSKSNRFLADWMEEAGYRTHAISTAGNQFPGKVQQSFQTVDLSLRPLGAAGARADAVTELILKALGQRQAGQALFVWAHYFDPHAPYVDPPGSAWAWGSDLQRYLAEIRRTDAAIGRLARALASGTEAEHVVVFLTADHGEEFGDKGARYHGFSLAEEAIRIPMLVWAPSAATVASTPTQLPVSIAEVGSYLAALVTGQPFQTSGEAFFSARTPNNLSVGIHADGWKLVHHRDFGFSELYDLSSDPTESVDLVKRRPDKRDQLGGRLAAYLKATGAPVAPSADEAVE